MVTSGTDLPELIPRVAAGRLAELAAHLRIVMVGGPRQAGKTTLLRQYLAAWGGSYRTLDRPDTLRAALDDPAAFAGYGDVPRIIDEVQRGGDDLVRAIKIAVDTDPRPGRFVLSGSSRILTIPTISESLAGRLAFVDLWPLSMAERAGVEPAGAEPAGAEPDILPAFFTDPGRLLADSPWDRDQYVRCVADGGFPEVLGIDSPLARRAWYDGYLHTVISRDIQSFATITHGDAVPRLLGLVAARAGGLTSLADLAAGVELARDTTRSYLSYLDMVYLTIRVPAWSSNLSSRLIKAPKIYPTDSGLAAHLLGAGPADLADPAHPAFGGLLETFAAGEMVKTIAASQARAALFHLRTADRTEVDFVVEDPGGRVVAFEVKASTSPGASALKGLRWLRGRLGDKMAAGVLLHLGHEAASHGDGIYAMPLSVLWQHRPVPPPPGSPA